MLNHYNPNTLFAFRNYSYGKTYQRHSKSIFWIGLQKDLTFKALLPGGKSWLLELWSLT